MEIETITPPERAGPTLKGELLGQPFASAAYSWNIWDMQVFNGRIYIGHGNSNDTGPSPNAGPVPVIYLDPVTNSFTTEYTVDEEQIDTYKVLNNKLCIPGHDSRESWDFGNFYSLENGTWTKSRTLPQAIHVLDLALYRGNLFAAVGTIGFGEVLMSTDSGKTWVSMMPASGRKFYTVAGRAYTLFELNDKLYAVSNLMNLSPLLNNNVLCIDGTTATTLPVDGTKMLPGAPSTILYKLVRTQVVNNNLLYIAGKSSLNYYWTPFALYITSDFKNARRVIFPASAALPMDIVVRGTTVYVLTHIKNSVNDYLNIVYSSINLSSWTELFRFRHDTFARSFEEFNGDFYFGMGCNPDNVSKSTGKIIKIPRSLYSI